MSSSVYMESFIDVLKNCESIMGVYSVVDSKSLEFLPIKQFFKQIKKVKGSKKDRQDKMINCGYYIASLSYAKGRCSFQRISILDFGRHNRVDLLANLLIPFNKRENLTRDVKNNIVSLMKYLEVLESQTADFIKTLSYRYIRLFIVFLYYGDYTHASMISDFILDQIFLGEDVDNSVKQKIGDLLKSRKEVEAIAERYIRNSEEDKDKSSVKEKFKGAVKEKVKDAATTVKEMYVNDYESKDDSSDFIEKIKRKRAEKSNEEESETLDEIDSVEEYAGDSFDKSNKGNPSKENPSASENVGRVNSFGRRDKGDDDR